MNALYLVLPLALMIASGAVLAFVWSVRSGQLDDLDTPACRLLLDDSIRAGFAPPVHVSAAPATEDLTHTQTPAIPEASDWHES